MTTTHNHAERIAAADTATRDELASALDAYRAEQGAELELSESDRPTWQQLVQYLIDNPPWHSYNSSSPASKLRALWSDFPVDTPYGAALATLARTKEGDRSFYLTIPAGGSFIVNGKQYAPAEGGPVTGTTINATFETAYDGRTAWRVQHNAYASPELSDSARRRLVEWIEAEGEALIFTAARVIARNLFDIATGAHSARKARDDAHTAARLADDTWNKAAGEAHTILAAAVVIAGGAE